MGNDVLLSAVTKCTGFAGINPRAGFEAQDLNIFQLLFLHSRLDKFTKHPTKTFPVQGVLSPTRTGHTKVQQNSKVVPGFRRKPVAFPSTTEENPHIPHSCRKISFSWWMIKGSISFEAGYRN